MKDLTVNHKDGDKENCEDYNLEWSTYRENNIHAKNSGLNKNYGSNHHLSKFTELQVDEICKYLEQGLCYTEILHKIGFENSDNNRDMIGNIKRRISWKRVSYKYNF